MDAKERAEITSGVKRGDIGIIVDVVKKYGLSTKGFGDDNSTIFHLAAKEGKVEFIDYLLSSGADETEVNDNGETPFHVAAKFNHSEVANLLARKRGLAMVNSTTSNEAQQTALHLACSNGHVTVMELLLDELDADPLIGANLFGRKGVTAVHLAVHLDQPISLFYLATWKDGKLLLAEDGDHNTPVHLAAKISQLAALRLLIEDCDADANEISQHTGLTVLQEAVAANLPDVVNCLVNELGADVNAKASTKGNSWSALHVAVNSNNAARLKLMMELKANVEQPDVEGNTPLHLAVRLKHLSLVEILLKEGKASIEARNNLGRTPLALVAAEHGDRKTAEFLIEKCGAKASARSSANDYDGATPLHLCGVKQNIDCAKVLIASTKKAAFLLENANGENALQYFVNKGNEKKVIKFILKHKSPVNEISSKSGRTALHMAAARDDADVAELLLKHGANAKAYSVGKGETNFTPAMTAAAFGARRVFRVLVNLEKKSMVREEGVDLDAKIVSSILQEALKITDRGEVIRFLTEQIKTTNVADVPGFMGRTPLHTSCLANKVDTVKQFIASGANVNAQSAARDFSRTPLHLAAMVGADAIVDLIVQAGAKLNRRDSNGNMPLHLASLAGRYSTVQKLMQLGAEVGKRGSSNKTALHHACTWIVEQGNDDDTVDNMEMLVGKFPEIVIRQPRAGSSLAEGQKVVLLPESVYDEKLSIVKLLVEQFPALASVRDDNSNRPIHLAAVSGHLEIVKFFVNWRQESFCEARSYHSRTLLQIALTAFQFETARYLMNEVKVSPNTRSAAEDHEQTALHLLISEGVVSKKLLTAIEVLVSSGVNLDAGDINGDTPLHYAVEACDRDSTWLDVVQLLIQSGANVNARLRKNLDTPVERAVSNKKDNPKIIEFFLSLFGFAFFDLNSLLKRAVECGNSNVADYLKQQLEMANSS